MIFANLNKSFITIVFFICALTGDLSAQGLLELKTEQDEYKAGPYIEILEDPDGSLNFLDIIASNYEDRFEASPLDVPNYGFTGSAFWVRFSLKNNSERISPWVLELGFANMHYADFYQLSNKKKLIKSINTGTMRPLKTRDHFHHKLVFLFQTSQDSINHFYMRFQNEAAMTIPLKIYSMTRFMEKSRRSNLLMGILIGILLIMAGYNFFLFFSLKESSYIYFSLFVTSLLLFIMSYNGISSILLWPDIPWWNLRSVALSMALMVVFFIRFSDQFLNVKEEDKKLHLIYNGLLGIGLIFILTINIFAYSFSILPLNLFILIVASYSIFIGFNFWRRGSRPAGYYLLSLLTLILGAFSIIFIRLQILPSNILTEDSFMLGSVIMVLMMSLALGDKINLLKSEKEDADRRLQVQESQFLDMVQNINDFVWEVDGKGIYTLVSPSVEKLLGYKPEEIIGKTPFDFMPPDEEKKIRAIFSEIAVKKMPIVRLVNRNIHKDGKIVVLETNGVPFMDENKKLLGYRGVDRDITDRTASENLQNAVYRISQATDQASDADELFKAIHEIILSVMEAKNFYIALYDEKKDMIEFTHYVDEKDITINSRKPGKGWTEYVLNSGESQLVDADRTRAMARSGEVELLGEPSAIWMGVPLVVNEKAIGVMAVQHYTDPHAYDEKDLQMMEFVSIQVAISIRKKQVDEQLRKLSRSVEQSPGMVVITDLEGKIEYVNKKFMQVTGYTIDDVKGKNPRILKSGNIPGQVYENLWRSITSGKEWHGELQNKKKNGEIYIQRSHISPYRNEQNEITHFIALSEDISELKNATDALFSTESNMRALLDATTDVAFLIDTDYKIIALNEAMAQTTNKTIEEMIGTNAFDGLRPELKNSRKMKIDEAIETGLPVRWEDMGIRGWSANSVYPVKDLSGNVTSLAVYSLDISERKRSEMVQEVMSNIASAVSETVTMTDFYEKVHFELNKLIDASNFFVGLYEEDNDTIFFPYTRDVEDENISRAPATNTLSGLVIKKKKSHLLTGDQITAMERKRDSNYIGSECKIWLGVPLEDGDKVIGVIVVQSYTDEKAYDRSDQALLEFVSKQVTISLKRKQSEEQIRLLSRSVDQSPALVLITDLDGKIEYVNSKFEEVTGYFFAEVKGKNPRILKSGKTPTSTYINLWNTIKSGRDWRGELYNKKKNGELYWEQVHITPYKNENGEVTRFVALKEDITDRKQLQEQLSQSQKMEAIGKLAGGIAHDFNNLLTVINGFSEIALMKIEDDSPIREDIETIQEASNKAEELTRQILAFSRKQIYQPEVVSINDVISEMEGMMLRLIGEDINVATHLAKRLPLVKADPGQIEQIIINLIVNARDAINLKTDKASEKKITIETDKVLLDDLYVSEHIGCNPGLHVAIIISDTGIGMAEKVKENIFEPFYTTKKQDEGTGLGLATVYGIVKQNEGNIFVYSEPGIGSTFKIFWPATEGKAKEKTIKDLSERHLYGTETILFVEDDLSIQNFGKTALENFGYTVHVAENGNIALDIINVEKSKIDLLVTDLVMPEMNGKELSDKIKGVFPDLRVLYASGYTDNHIVHSGELEENVEFLQKPYSVKALLTKIRFILDSPYI